MKVKAVTAIMLLLLLASVSSIVLNVTFVASVVASPSTIRVPQEYPTIQEAINGAGEGDVISVGTGIYYELITVNKPLVLLGQNKETTIIDGNGTGTVIKIIGLTNIRISGFTVRNGKTYGIEIRGSDQNIISENNVENTKYQGIYLGGSNGNLIFNNTISNIDGNAIDSNGATDNIIIANRLMNNSGHGISMVYSTDNMIVSNTIKNNRGNGIDLSYNSKKNTLLGNIITNDQKFEWGRPTVNAIHLDSGCENTTIIGNNISNCYVGIYVYQCANNVIYHNNIIDNYHQGSQYTGTVNQWDNGVEGNYWSDYAGQDLNGDEVGDTPYTTSYGWLTDNYPLMSPFQNLAPTADFTYSPTNPTRGQNVQFTDASVDPDGEIERWIWDFGDGYLSTERNPIHGYAKEDNYTISLIGVDNKGAIHAASKTIVVTPGINYVPYIILGVAIAIISFTTFLAVSPERRKASITLMSNIGLRTLEVLRTGKFLKTAISIGVIVLFIAALLPWVSMYYGIKLHDSWSLLRYLLNLSMTIEGLKVIYYVQGYTDVATSMAITMLAYPMAFLIGIIAPFLQGKKRYVCSLLSGVLAVLSGVLWIYAIEVAKAKTIWGDYIVKLGIGTYVAIIAGTIVLFSLCVTLLSLKREKTRNA